MRDTGTTSRQPAAASSFMLVTGIGAYTVHCSPITVNGVAMAEKEKLPNALSPELVEKRWTARESWRVFRIMSEFVEATERLSAIRPAVSIFGSARTPPGHPYYVLAENIARQLSDAGFSVISGGGPGIMEAVNKGAYAGASPSVGLNKIGRASWRERGEIGGEDGA